MCVLSQKHGWRYDRRSGTVGSGPLAILVYGVMSVFSSRSVSVSVSVSVLEEEKKREEAKAVGSKRHCSRRCDELTGLADGRVSKKTWLEEVEVEEGKESCVSGGI